jgi:hypothetical protein
MSTPSFIASSAPSATPARDAYWREPRWAHKYAFDMRLSAPTMASIQPDGPWRALVPNMALDKSAQQLPDRFGGL